MSLRFQCQEFSNEFVVRVFHRNQLHAEAIPFCQSANFGRVVISQHHRATHRCHEGEKSFVVNLVMSVEAVPGLLPSRRVRRVNEKERISIFGVTLYDLEGVGLLKRDSVAHGLQSVNAMSQRFRIPTGMQASPSLASFHEASACGHDAAALHPVLDDGAEGSAAHAFGVAVENGADVLKRHIETDNLLTQPRDICALALKDRLPNSGHVIVKFAEKDVFGQTLGSGCQSRHRATGERFNKNRWGAFCCGQPTAHLRDKPCFSTRIAKRTELPHLSNVSWSFPVLELRNKRGQSLGLDGIDKVIPQFFERRPAFVMNKHSGPRDALLFQSLKSAVLPLQRGCIHYRLREHSRRIVGVFGNVKAREHSRRYLLDWLDDFVGDTVLKHRQRYWLTSRQPFYRALQCGVTDFVAHDARAFLPFDFFKPDDKPRNVSVGNIGYVVHFADGIEEGSINDDSHFLAPSPERWHFDLKLRHQSLWAAASVIRATATSREDDPIHCGIVEGFKLYLHRVAREIDSLNFKCRPCHRGAFSGFVADQNHVNAAYVIATFVVGGCFGFEEADFTDEQRIRIAKDDFTYPLEHVQFAMEAVWTCCSEFALLSRDGNTNRPTCYRVYGVRVEPERTDSAFLRTHCLLLRVLKGTRLRGSFFLRFEDFGSELAAFFTGKLRKVIAEPFAYPESRCGVFGFCCHNGEIVINVIGEPSSRRIPFMHGLGNARTETPT